MKKIIYLTFYFEPDLCAGSFRNTPLVKELAAQLADQCEIEVITTMPNRYQTFKVTAEPYEQNDNLVVHRIVLPEHKSGFLDQALSFISYFRNVIRITKSKEYDLVVASSSRLFTAYLGYRLARTKRARLYLDIRDIFTDTMKDVIKSGIIKTLLLPVLRNIEKKTFSKANHINLISEGFRSYFLKYDAPEYSFFSNGVDEEFIDMKQVEVPINKVKKIVYAGNIGEGQGLHIFIPEAAGQLIGKYEFIIIGDGGAKEKLRQEISRLQLPNVQLLAPVKRATLIEMYQQADFLFLHLNNYDAFEKVVPSKIFELAAFDLPIIAGVKGFARTFIEKNVSNVILFDPGDVTVFLSKLSSFGYKREKRNEFISRFRRNKLNKEMAYSIASYIS